MSTQQQLPPPVVSAEVNLLEITVKGLILGVILSILLASANAYIGLLVGLTVSASIPAAAVSMGILRLFPRSNILENNMVQTAASAGESLVAGAIFTIPALVMMKAWGSYEYWPIVSIMLVGGILGVAFTIPLRRALIVEAKLTYPEGVATGEVLKTGGIETKEGQSLGVDAQKGFKALLQAAGIGGLFKLLESGFGVLAGGVNSVKSLFQGSYLFSGGITLSPALLGVGYIVGLNIATLVFLGGVIGTIIGVPLNWILNSEAIMTTVGIDPSTPWGQLKDDQWAALAGESWSNCRRIGVGAMIVGGIWSLISLYRPLVDGIKASLAAYQAKGDESAIPRTEQDTPINIVAWVVGFSILPLLGIFYFVLDGYEYQLSVAILMTFLMLIFGFIFSSVAGYMAGLVGSSNNPISGVTIATVITSALILLQIMGDDGVGSRLGPIAVIFLAGIICSAAAIAGDNMQDLKCGHVVGATPWKQQLYQIIGVVSAAFVIPVVLQILDLGYGIGRPSPNPDISPTAYLAAPQAGLMRDLATGIFGAGIKWNYIFLGFILAVVLIILDQIQLKRNADFRFPVLAVAVGVYLPLGLSVPIFIGGLLVHFVKKRLEDKTEDNKKRGENTGLLLASGLITGEALMGVLIALAAVIGINLPSHIAIGGLLGVIAIIAVMAYLYKTTLKSAE